MSRHVDVVIVFSEIGFKFIDRKRKIITDFGMKKEKHKTPLWKKKKKKTKACRIINKKLLAWKIHTVQNIFFFRKNKQTKNQNDQAVDTDTYKLINTHALALG